MVTANTHLSELHRLLEQAAGESGRARLIRSVEQSMRAEGYPVSHEEAVSAADRVLDQVA